ncbi:MAG: dinitrogenase reductase [Fibrobacteria bacterium]|nr:dinitrogenase reductase [Fibrobacteria bacterium]
MDRTQTDSTPSVFSRCSLPPWALASQSFQDNPWPVEIVGVRTSESRLFSRLDACEDVLERGRLFHGFLCERFLLGQWAEHKGGDSRKAHDIVRFLRGWGADSNGRSGAVLKSWVESRFGLRPTYHHGRLRDDPSARERYAEDRMRGEAATMGVAMQLDLLYTYCQYEFERQRPGERWVTLYRGTHDPEEYAVKGGDEGLVELNNLSSFTSDREIAWEFGSSVWEVRVPVPKIVFYSGLLPRNLLEGECEHLVLGGEYRVRRLAW